MNQGNNVNQNNNVSTNSQNYVNPNMNIQNLENKQVNTNQMNTQNVRPQENVVKPVQTVNTNNKKTSNIIWFIIVILVGVFIYFIDDILAYFNQSFSPVIESKTSENGSANLIDGFIKIGNTNSYIKLKSIRFYNVKKSNNALFISYISDKNYTASLPLEIVIELYNESKEKIYEEDFNVYGSIESNTSRQYKITLEDNTLNNAYYCLIKTK